jgi:hypothetical protein
VARPGAAGRPPAELGAASPSSRSGPAPSTAPASPVMGSRGPDSRRQRRGGPLRPAFGQRQAFCRCGHGPRGAGPAARPRAAGARRAPRNPPALTQTGAVRLGRVEPHGADALAPLRHHRVAVRQPRDALRRARTATGQSVGARDGGPCEMALPQGARRDRPRRPRRFHPTGDSRNGPSPGRPRRPRPVPGAGRAGGAKGDREPTRAAFPPRHALALRRCGMPETPACGTAPQCAAHASISGTRRSRRSDRR